MPAERRQRSGRGLREAASISGDGRRSTSATARRVVQGAVQRRPDGRLRRRLRRSGHDGRASRWATTTTATSPTTGTSPTTTCCSTGSSRRRTAGSVWNHMFWVTGTPGQPATSTRSRRAASTDVPTIFDRLEAAGISWKFYVQNYDPTNTFRTRRRGDRASQTDLGAAARTTRATSTTRSCSRTSSTWPVLQDAQEGTLPAVAFIAPAGSSEHPPGRIQAGQSVRARHRHRADAEPAVAVVGVHVDVRRLGRLVRPRQAAEGRRLRLRLPRAGAAGQRRTRARVRRPDDRSTSRRC